MSELSRHLESPDDDRPRQPDGQPDPPRELGDPFDPDVGVVERVARAMESGDQPAMPPSRFDFDRASVIDRLVGPQETSDAQRGGERLALERLCNDLGRDLHDTVSQDTWETADQDKRAELAGQIDAQVKERYGLGEGELTISSELDEERMGEFTRGKVVVSERLLSEATPHELIDTIAHENEHALQVEITSGRRAHPLGEFAAAEVAAWREGEENYNPDDFMGKGYTYNPLEVDSRHAGVLVVEGYLKAQIAAQSEQIEKLKAQTKEISALKEENQALRADVEQLRELYEKLAAERDPNRPD